MNRGDGKVNNVSGMKFGGMGKTPRKPQNSHITQQNCPLAASRFELESPVGTDGLDAQTASYCVLVGYNFI